jgi:hypothetical protein
MSPICFSKKTNRRKELTVMTTLLCVLASLTVAMAVATASADALDVSVGETRIIMRGANYPVLLKAADGSIVLDAAVSVRKRAAVISADGGRTWKDCPATVRTGHDGSRCVLPDGTILAFGQHTRPAKGQPGRFRGSMWMSSDNWQTVRGPSPTYVEMSQVVSGYGDGGLATPISGPLFHGRSFSLSHGGLLATMYTNFVADTKYAKTGEMHKWRCVLVKSTDRGKNWKYVSTIASLEQITDRKLLRRWQDGFDEPSLEILPDGKLICVMRTGTYVGEKAVETYSDLSRTVVRKGKHMVSNGEPTRPIYQATSRDGGKTWTRPRPVPHARGACPRLLLLSNGVLALSYGRLCRPTQGDSIIFSADGGKTWTNETNMFPGLSSGYTDMVETGPGKILYVFDSVTAWGPNYTQDWIGAVHIEVKVRQVP